VYVSLRFDFLPFRLRQLVFGSGVWNEVQDEDLQFALLVEPSSSGSAAAHGVSLRLTAWLS